MRSTSSAAAAQPFEDDPESILRKARQYKRAKKSSDTPFGLAKSIKTPFIDGHPNVDSEDDRDFDPDLLQSRQDTDSEPLFYRYWGYLSPLDENVVALINLLARRDNALELITPNSSEYLEGLEWRNVNLNACSIIDHMANHIKELSIEGKEADAVKELYEETWTADLEKCREEPNNMLFRRTLMIDLIARHLLIYNKLSAGGCLDFSVEAAWDCPPMPTRAYTNGRKFLPRSKPDLAVCFRREAIISDNDLWHPIPAATKQLACYEERIASGRNKVFHFLTIQAKGINGYAEKLQSLNNASQSLHNMFEFFRDAGPEHEKVFFDKVRFFSVVASRDDLKIRIHRATQASADSLVVPNYPLRFEYNTFLEARDVEFSREKVIDIFGKILIGYGVETLCPLLRKAADSLIGRMKGDSAGREDENYYRYGQTYPI